VHRRRRRWIVAVLGLVAVGGTALAVALTTRRDDERPTSKVRAVEHGSRSVPGRPSSGVSTTAGTASGSTTSRSPGTTAVATPQFTVAPATQLRDGQTVRIEGSGFRPGAEILVYECGQRSDATGSGCNLPGLVRVDAAADGSVRSDFTVKAGPFGKDGVVCAAVGSEPCLLSVGEASPDAPHPTVRLSFSE
jgi:hypothetical protein